MATNITTNQSNLAANVAANTARRAKQRPQLIGAIDQGTSSTRFLVFENKTGQLIASSQIEIQRIVPKEGWVEIDPIAIMDSVYSTIESVYQQLETNVQESLRETIQLECIGICNQRESTVVWDSQTGKPLYNVIVWMDNRTKDIVDQMIDSVPGRDFNFLKDKTGLPMSTYFSAFKLKWLIDNVEQVKFALKENRLLFGTVDSWILWNLTGKHLTDVTNASRTFLMDIETLEWDKQLCKHFNIPIKILPKILSSADSFGEVLYGPLKGLPITGVIGDQSAALFGHNCLQLGQTKATFGTGCFIMQNIGAGPLNGALSGVQRGAKKGLITTVGYKLKGRPACYALEGSIKIAGAALTWMRDNMQLIQNYDECDKLVNMTTHSAGVFFVPALGGLYSPYWDPNAAGLYIGLSQFTRREHLIRATFDSIAFQTNDILSLMRGVTNGLMIDGGLCKSDNMCQILADITGCDIVRPSMCETSALGAAMVAGCGAGIWSYESMLANSDTPYEYSSSSNQNHHYPHESLHYEDRFSSLIQTKNKKHNHRLATTTTAAAATEASYIIQKRTDEAALDGGGGGINDDAGGGGNNDIENPTSSLATIKDDDTQRLISATTLSIYENEIVDDDDEDDDEDVTTSGEYTTNSSDMLICNQEVRAAAIQLLPSGNSCNGFGGNVDNDHDDDDDEKERRHQKQQEFQTSIDSSILLTNNDVDDIHIHETTVAGEVAAPIRATVDRLFYPTPSSGYTSCGDNFDNSTTTTESSTIRMKTYMDDIMYLDQQQQQANGGSSNNNNSNSDTIGTVIESELELIEKDELESVELYAGSKVCLPSKQVDVFQPYISLEHRTELVNTWRRAVERSMHWTKIHHEEIRRIDYQRLSSLPISMYLFFSIGMVALSGILSVGGRTFFTR